MMIVDKIEYNCRDISTLGAELVFTQDQEGNYISFFWQPTEDISLSYNNPPSHNCIDFLCPLPLAPYLERIRRVMARRIPEQCHYILNYRGKDFPFELIISPIIDPYGEVNRVLVMGHRLQFEELALTSPSSLPTNPDPFQQVLTRIARNIRSTLDLDTIGKQTVDSIGEALQVSRCLLLVPSPQAEVVLVKAEYCLPAYESMLGCTFDVDKHLCLQEALSSQKPCAYHDFQFNGFQCQSSLVVGTFYQKEFNSILVLHQCDRPRHWNVGEVELIQELADQVGTAIAHATIYKKLEEANQEAEEASRLKSEFLASTSHELRTPLNGMLGFLQLVLDDMADTKEEEREFISQAYNSALHLLNLINDILDIARIEANKIEFKFEQISLNQICEEVAKFAHNQAVRKKIDFNINLPPTYDPIIIYSDYQRLLQIMFNLVGNSLKFTHQGSISISAEIISKPLEFRDEQLPGFVKISVEDTGIGVSLEKQDNLFEKFYQVDGSRTKAYGGTGLGLAISKRLIETMGGKISFYSMGEDLGSTVTLTVPLMQLPIIKE
ncbi:GAF sensor signal transduction histidine kinase [Cyanobacterium stanieri PCC 7202]|uniref:Circadian input-output histidine kinase CikA n=1 Tax=Cyanobacterium stanieri (strain ATCC 29140 / PCC 7202) TaxID=292563 RepID=K9YN62_CYASC|nr:GAF sensor signal transduction histidine kinase [Cyanobacterium stanieri PCC 7202]